MDNGNNEHKNRPLGWILITLAVAVLAGGWYGSLRNGDAGLLTWTGVTAAVLLLPGFYLLGGQTGFFGRQVFFKIKIDERDMNGNRVPQILDGRSGTVEARVLGVSRSLRFGDGSGLSYVLICRYTDPETGKTQDLTSEEMEEYPGREVIGEMVRVKLNPRDPEGYFVDVEELLDRIYS